MTLVLLGPHAVGKSSLGRALAHRLGWPFHAEVGHLLALEQGPERRAQQPQQAFDREVFRRELERDAQGGPRVVETWHPGNLAYAAHRSPGVVDASLSAVRASMGGGPAAAIALSAPRSVLAHRQHEAGDLDFFLRVGRDAEAWARRLDLPLLARIDTSTGSPEQLVARLLPLLRSTP